MELIEDEAKAEGALPEPRYKAELPDGNSDDDDGGRPKWLLPLIIAIIVAAIVVGLVFLARWIYHEINHSSAPPASSNTNKQPPAVPGAQSGAKSTGAPAGGKNTPAGASSSQTDNSRIANTGPGDVVGIFVGASLAAAGLHYIISVRRFNKNGA